MNKIHFTPKQLRNLLEVHKVLCSQRMIDQTSFEGRDIAHLLLKTFTGDEPKSVILKKFCH